MQRRKLIALLGGAAAWPIVAQAQPTKRLPVVGVFWAYPNAEVAGGSRVGLLKGFEELGYVAGRNFILEERYAGYDSPERFDTVAVSIDSY